MTELQVEVLQLRKEGKTPKEIANVLKKSVYTIRQICKKYGVEMTQEEIDRAREKAGQLISPEEYISRRTDKVRYHHGYVNSDGKAWVECNDCGFVFELSMVTVRASSRRGGNVECPQCVRMQKHKTWKRLPAQENGKQIELLILVCEECGTVFTSKRNNARFCPDCRRRRANNHKDHRITKDKKVDKDITLRKLYARDEGRCWICGELCDINAEPNSQVYPSIDHVLAISQGGEHSWANVRLAHRGCNNKRYYNEQRYAPSVAGHV